jgi:hypothetical protein
MHAEVLSSNSRGNEFQAEIKKIPLTDSATKHGLRLGPRSHGQLGRHERVEERRFTGFLDLHEIFPIRQCLVSVLPQQFFFDVACPTPAKKPGK